MLEGTSVTEPPLSWIVLPVTETGLIALLKFTLTSALVPTLLALLMGASETMVGAALSTAVPAVKFEVKACTGTPLVLVTELKTFN